LAAFPTLFLDSTSDVPLYKQIADALVANIEKGVLRSGEKLPATRELSVQLHVNRTTVSAAYALLEESGFIQGHVGRGSFITHKLPSGAAADVRATASVGVNFASSRPAHEAFPLAQFRRSAKAVIDSDEAAEILQLGSPYGYGPLRRYLLEEAKAEGVVRSGDDLIVTNGCQQALDLLARSFVSVGAGVMCEDPVYPGLLRVLTGHGAQLIPVPVGPSGLDLDIAEDLLQRHAVRMVVVTPNFQNPTGATVPLEGRRRLVRLARASGALLVENDIYGDLRYQGESVPTLKHLDETGNSVLLRSYSKVSFPGLRVGWAIGPREVIAKIAEEKQMADLHSDQLSQAVSLSFAQSGELERHLERTRQLGAERLRTILQACEDYLPVGSKWTEPQGGMSLWLELPGPLTAEGLLQRVREQGVDFLPGSHFSSRPEHVRSLRLGFGSVSPEKIRQGVRVLGETAARELAAGRYSSDFEPAMALV